MSTLGAELEGVPDESTLKQFDEGRAIIMSVMNFIDGNKQAKMVIDMVDSLTDMQIYGMITLIKVHHSAVASTLAHLFIKRNYLVSLRSIVGRLFITTVDTFITDYPGEVTQLLISRLMELAELNDPYAHLQNGTYSHIVRISAEKGDALTFSRYVRKATIRELCEATNSSNYVVVGIAGAELDRRCGKVQIDKDDIDAVITTAIKLNLHKTFTTYCADASDHILSSANADGMCAGHPISPAIMRLITDELDRRSTK